MHRPNTMEKLDQILNSFVAVGVDTNDKVLGASFIVANKDGLRGPVFKPLEQDY